ncbi:hypothetical protein LINPERPRIM_LOCUS33077, partial [Linum perenne]
IELTERLVATTWQSLAANCRAKAWPMPPSEQPVIRTTSLPTESINYCHNLAESPVRV